MAQPSRSTHGLALFLPPWHTFHQRQASMSSSRLARRTVSSLQKAQSRHLGIASALQRPHFQAICPGEMLLANEH